ncbi:nucleotidyltransferase domain-containing protein [Merismopedia glauca]|uniref:Nucleotidyltransferase family protein n=1 Tax=Merismopedia glauca CCAP 1448/3 TaxID=1296344 RepID=A0A2T1C4Y4_9CYAN|nr:nucleotidyltransferase family protein [Merismopedia glauca]PSB03311.1 hypothetical protein C7B64_09045 [Merismopedia glauca CCAP 1448/3]
MTVTEKPILKDSDSQYSSEVKLLLLCVRPQIDEESAEEILKLVKAEIDWNYLIDTATQHKVIPLVYCKLNGICPSYIPEDILQEMRQIFHNNSKKNLVLTEKLIQIINLLQNNNIPCLTFKGVTLGILAYQKIFLRTFTDLDILIPKKSVSRTTKLLIEHGYEPQFNFSESQQKTYLEIRNEQTFANSKRNITLDIHWSLLAEHLSFCLKTEDVWQFQQEVNINGNLIPSLSPEIMVLYLCTNGAKDSWIYLQSICDLARLIDNHPNLNWEQVMAQAGRLGTRKMLFLGLSLCQILFNLPLPPKIRQQILTEPQIEILVNQVTQNLFDDARPQEFLLIRKRIYLKTMDSWRDRILFYFDIIRPTPLEWKIVELPKWLSPLYYPIRLIRLAIKHSQIKIASFTGSKARSPI